MLVAYLGHTRTPGQAEANARLIAAAPELLDALKDLLASYGDLRRLAGLPIHGDAADGEPVMWTAEAAIARATKPEG